MKYQPEYDPTEDPGNPYQHLLDDETDDVEEDIKLGLSVYGLTIRRPKRR